MEPLHDHYPFGSLLPGRNYSSDSYRFGFNGQEKDDEMHGATGTSYSYTYRMHDARVGRFLSIDPLAAKYPHNSPYAFSENRVIDGRELEGLEFAYYGVTLNNPNTLLELVGYQETIPLTTSVMGLFDWEYGEMNLPEVYLLQYDGSNYMFGSYSALNEAAQSVAATMAFDEFGDGVYTGEFPSALEGVNTLEDIGTMMDGMFYISDNVGGVLTGIAGKYATRPQHKGTIYEVPGSATTSGDPYVGRHNKSNPAQTRRSADGRDRTKARVIDTFDETNPEHGPYKEQKAMDSRGGLDKLDNKRREVSPERMEKLEKKYGK